MHGSPTQVRVWLIWGRWIASSLVSWLILIFQRTSQPRLTVAVPDDQDDCSRTAGFRRSCWQHQDTWTGCGCSSYKHVRRGRTLRP